MNKALLQRVANRGKTPEEFITELVRWAGWANDAVFAPNKRYDIYSRTVGMLGPWRTMLHRKAAMCEVLRVLAGFESAWHWEEDYDVTNPAENSLETKSAGVFQISANSRHLDDSLMSYVKAYGVSTPAAFRQRMMKDHRFAFDYTARLLRVSLDHNGPVKRGEILPWLRLEAVAAFEEALGGGEQTTKITTA